MKKETIIKLKKLLNNEIKEAFKIYNNHNVDTNINNIVSFIHLLRKKTLRNINTDRFTIDIKYSLFKISIVVFYEGKLYSCTFTKQEWDVISKRLEMVLAGINYKKARIDAKRFEAYKNGEVMKNDKY